MKIVDIHTHMFPDKIAKGTLDFLEGVCMTVPHTDGTAKGLEKSAEESGVDLAVSLPAVTKPSQVESVNRFASGYQEGRVISFGGIHPECENYRQILRDVRNMGMKGIKLHPDYQDVYFKDIRYKRIVSYAAELGLVIVVHSGRDPKSPDNIHCTPAMAREVIRDVQPDKLVLAHLGGNECWEEVEEYLVGEPVYFDTAVILDKVPEEQFLRIVQNHGADRILFGTDSPWAGQKEYIDILKGMPLTEREKAMIFGENAWKILGLS